MQKAWSVELSAEADKKLRADFKHGLISAEDIRVIRRWIVDIEEQGLDFAQHKPDWRDHPLDGAWKGYRSMSFSYAGRVIYRIENEKIIVRVVRVTANHDYRK